MSIKILHISFSDKGGAGMCAYRINKTLQNKGIDSKMLVMYKSQEDDSVYIAHPIKVFIYRAFHAILRLLHIYVSESDKLLKKSITDNSCYTSPIGPLDICNHRLVKEADIIHIHWANAYFDQPKFFSKVQKPIVWTIHDENLFYGISHYHNNRDTNDPLEKKYREMKLKMLSGKNNVNIVLLSKYFKEHFGNDPLLEGKNVEVINNFVDCAKFINFDQKTCKKELGIDEDNLLLVFIAVDITDENKSLYKLINAVESMDKKENIRIIAIGENKKFAGNKHVTAVGKIYNPIILSRYLSAADFYVMVSDQEAFSQAPIEAMACGTPVIVTPVSGTYECVNEETGVICQGFTEQDIVNGIKCAICRPYDRNKIRQFAIKKFSPDIIIDQYIKLYNKIMRSTTVQ